MSDPSEIFCSLPPEYTGGANDSEPALTVPGVAPHEGAHLILTIYGAMPLKTMACNDPLTLRRSMSSV